ncbi:transporter substrate-binding domain-containing protein [Siminovitchia sp. FSL H7-0308]|uniref:transporter substrate-binding domain-containing protein n=1 Tax=Siminovitchia sp. FSL H7-0308 TaxID=2921432 RepID=UPI0030EC34CD
MFLFKKTALLLAIFYLFFFVTALADTDQEVNGGKETVPDIREQHVLLVGFDPNFPPYQFEKDGEYTGFNIDFMNKVAKHSGFRVKYIPMNVEKSIEALQKQEIDIILGVPFTGDLSERVEFSERYIVSAAGVLVPKNSPVQSVTDLQEQRIAIQYRTPEYDFLRNIRDIHYHSAHQPKTAINILFKERADAFVGNYITAKYFLEENGLEDKYQLINTHLLPLEYSFAVQKGNYSLLHQLNLGIRQIKLTESYSDIYHKWFENFESPLSEKLKKIREFLIFIVIFAIVVFLVVYKWNRELEKEVALKTHDLQMMNESLKRQIQKTKNSDQLKEQILESSARGVITFSLYGYITSINRMAMNMLGVEQKPTGRHMNEFSFLSKMLKGRKHAVLGSGKNIMGEELKTTSPSGAPAIIRYDIHPLYDIDQSISGVLLMFEDVTVEKQLKDQLQEEEKSRALIQLVAGIAHEIRNPLTSIKTFVQLIPKKMENARFRNEIATLVPKEIDRLNQLIEGLIHYAKPVSKEKKRFDIGPLLKNVIRLFKQNMENKNIKIEYDIVPNLWIEADESQVKQVLINLFLNAIESMEHVRREKTLYVNALCLGDEAVITIRDKGEGMTAEQAKKIFEPFYTSKEHGTGLGLSLSKQFVIENNGSLALESKLGEGSTFILKFPKKESRHHEIVNH